MKNLLTKMMRKLQKKMVLEFENKKSFIAFDFNMGHRSYFLL